MLNLEENTTIYIVSSRKKTGGPQSLHQLAFLLQEMGCTVKMYYIDPLGQEVPQGVPYKQYSLQVSQMIADCKENILIVPEIFTDELFKYQNIQGVVWWLSWTNFALQHVPTLIPHLLRPRKLKGLRKGIHFVWLFARFLVQYRGLRKRKHILTNKNDFARYLHLYNCEYAANEIQKRGALPEKMHYLCGPVAFRLDEVSVENKKPLVLYNRVKVDLDFIHKIADNVQVTHPEIQFKMIANMTPQEVSEQMAQAKVYIDLGFFPGPERMPREAVMHHCNIITSDQGAAKNKLDVPIPSQYKFTPEDCNLEKITNAVISLVENYEQHVPEFDAYRVKVIDQQNRFVKDISEIFGIDDKELEKRKYHFLGQPEH